MRAAIVIPCRYGSTRFPGKPLATIAGRSLVERVWRVGKAVAGVDHVVVATDDKRIADHVQSFGGTAVMTSEACQNGSERAFEAVEKLNQKIDIIVNLQGDTPLTPPWTIEALITEMRRDPAVQLSTPAVQLSREELDRLVDARTRGIVGGTTVVFDKNHNAFYFSKNIIPYTRTLPATGPTPVYRHVGLYAYTHQTLKRYVELPESTLEKIEQLEQLRALENGIPIRVVPVDFRGRTSWSVDNPSDVGEVERIIAAEGELI